MNILYLHGLNGSLSLAKQHFLQQFGNIKAPVIDYENNTDCINWLHNRYIDDKIDLIVGSSMGGFAGYYLSKLFMVPALLFNPALSYRSVFQNVPLVPESNKSTITIVLGSKDNIINPSSTLSFLGNLLMQPQNYNIHIQHGLEHRIPIRVFEYEVNKWMENLNITN